MLNKKFFLLITTRFRKLNISQVKVKFYKIKIHFFVSFENLIQKFQFLQNQNQKIKFLFKKMEKF